MVRRIGLTLVLLASLVLPQMAGALPREELGVTESEATYASIQTLTVPSNGNLVYTNSLVKGRQYRFKVSGTWRFGTSSQQADMAFSTSDSWSSASKSPLRSLEIDGVKQSATAVAYSSAHVYNTVPKPADVDAPVALRIADDNYADGNSGSLLVEVLRASRVTYSSSTLIPLLGVPTIPLEEKVLLKEETNNALTGIVVAVPKVNYPGTSTAAFFNGAPDGTGYCFWFTTPNGTSSPRACLPNLINQQQTIGPYPVGETQPMALCDAGSCDVRGPAVTAPGFTVPATSVPDAVWPASLGARPLQPGSGLQVTVDWTGDRDHLFLAASALGGPSKYSTYLPFDPTNPSEISWYQSNKDRLGAKINIALLFPDGSLSGGQLDQKPDPYYPIPQGVSIPGLGQFLEASFSSRVAEK